MHEKPLAPLPPKELTSKEERREVLEKFFHLRNEELRNVVKFIHALHGQRIAERVVDERRRWLIRFLEEWEEDFSLYDTVPKMIKRLKDQDGERKRPVFMLIGRHL